jgi:hypothetical protein
LVVIILILFVNVFSLNQPPSNIKASFAETSIDIDWDSIPQAVGYNVYNHERKINAVQIKSGTHFTYIWDRENGEHVRKIKGYEHSISITSLFEIDGKIQESVQSKKIDNLYFEGYRNVILGSDIKKILQKKQQQKKLPVNTPENSAKNFIRFMETTGKKLHTEISKNINPLESGGCAPVSTVLVKLLQKNGLTAVKAEGVFIKEFHAFVIINIEGVEYVLDFTADQFVPAVSPVFIPRDFCFLGENARLSKTGLPIYQISRIYSADNVSLTDSEDAEIYKQMLDSLSRL